MRDSDKSRRFKKGDIVITLGWYGDIPKGQIGIIMNGTIVFKVKMIEGDFTNTTGLYFDDELKLYER